MLVGDVRVSKVMFLIYKISNTYCLNTFLNLFKAKLEGDVNMSTPNHFLCFLFVKSHYILKILYVIYFNMISFKYFESFLCSIPLL